MSLVKTVDEVGQLNLNEVTSVSDKTTGHSSFTGSKKPTIITQPLPVIGTTIFVQSQISNH
jgi:hypothetical protein